MGELNQQNGAVVSKPPTNKRQYAFICCCLVQIMVWSDEFTFATLTPYWSAHFSFDPVQIASISSAYLLGYFPMLLVGGVLADIIGARKNLLIAVAGCGILSLCMLACTGSDTMWWRNFAFGIFFGFAWAPENKMMANWLPASERAARASLWGTLSTASQIFIAPLSLMIASHLNWQAAFVLVTIVSVPVFILVSRVKDNPADQKGISQEEVDYINAGRDEEALKNEKMNLKAIGGILKDWNCWVALIAMSMATMPTWCVATWGSYVLISGYGMSSEGAASLIATMSLMPVAFSLLTGFFLKKVFRGNIKLLFVFAPVIGISAFLISSFGDVSAVTAGVLLFGVAYCTNAWGWGGANMYWGAYAKPETWGTLNGLVSFTQVGLGYVFVQFSGAWVREGATMGGFGDLFFYAGLVWGIGIIAALIMKNRKITDTYETRR